MYVCAHWWGVGGIGKKVCSIKDVRLEVGDWQNFSKNILLCVTMADGKDRNSKYCRVQVTYNFSQQICNMYLACGDVLGVGAGCGN